MENDLQPCPVMKESMPGLKGFDLSSSALLPELTGLAPADGWDLNRSFNMLNDTGAPAVIVGAPL